jgi:hypothetical protein
MFPDHASGTSERTSAMSQAMTAVYETRGAAESARDGLLAIGIPERDILIRGAGDPDRSAASESGSGEHGFWENLFELFIPRSEHPTYLEGLRRGAFMVGVQVPDGRERDAEKVLEGCDPIDLNEHARGWRDEGWDDRSPSTSQSGRERAGGIPCSVAGMGGASIAAAAGPSNAAASEAGTSRASAAAPALDPATTPLATSGGTSIDSDTGGELASLDQTRADGGQSPSGGNRLRVRRYHVDRPLTR